MLRVTLSYKGDIADTHRLNFYDAAQAMVAFQRTLALTTHLLLNGEIITQAPALRGAQILIGPVDEGSLKINAYIASALTGLYFLGTAPHDTPLGNLVYSAYDYVVSESLGFHVDYDKTLGQMYEDLKKKKDASVPILDQTRFDSLIEKCEPNIIQMHRPISQSKTAHKGAINFSSGTSQFLLTGGLDMESYEFAKHTERNNILEPVSGKVSSYNINTFKGRIYCTKEHRPVPFELSEDIRKRKYIRLITTSLSRNAINRDADDAQIYFNELAPFSTGHLGITMEA